MINWIALILAFVLGGIVGMMLMGVLAGRIENRRSHWIDNADSYICPVCGSECDSPARYEGSKCPKCGFQDEKDKDGGAHE